MFENVTANHIEEAIIHLNDSGIPARQRSRIYATQVNGREYPPKYLITVAYRLANDGQLPGDFNTYQAQAKLEELGYKTRILNEPPFFTTNDFDLLKELAGEHKDKSNAHHTEVYDELKKTYARIEFWARRIQEEIFPDGKIDVLRKPTNQGNVFSEYQWAKIYPTQSAPFELAYTVSIETEDKFVIKIDTATLLDHDPRRQEYFKYRGEWNNSPIVNIYDASEIIPLGWEKLVDLSTNAIKHLSPHYDRLLKILLPEIHSKKVNEMHALNTILFGPPGTGKTFNSISHALAILESKPVESILNENRADIKARFDKFLHQGRVVFTTFHQSMSYEDFIEGIKPETIEEQVVYEVKDGIFKILCVEASFSIAQSIKNDTKDRTLIFSNLYDYFVDSVEKTMSYPGSYAEVPTKSGGKIKIEGISAQGNIIVKHPEGTRTYTVSKQRLTELDRNLGDLEKVSNVNTAIREVIGGSNSSAYYALLKVIRSLQPATRQQQRTYSFDDKIGVVKALNTEDYRKSAGEPYVIIIDEINRGNISQIFGELITLIEDDKRLGKSESLKVTLPYSKEKFGVPPSVYIIGTMNTADRSVEALDTALRRRFSFIEIPPNPNLIAIQEKLNIDLAELLKTINRRIEKLLDKDHLIGHSYFMNVRSIPDLKEAFQNKINPLLQEYFYGDFGKIGLVIGNDFFLGDSVNTTDDSRFFADFEYEATDLLERRTYRLKNVIEMSDSDFIFAINKLLRK